MKKTTIEKVGDVERIRFDRLGRREAAGGGAWIACGREPAGLGRLPLFGRKGRAHRRRRRRFQDGASGDRQHARRQARREPYAPRRDRRSRLRRDAAPPALEPLAITSSFAGSAKPAESAPVVLALGRRSATATGAGSTVATARRRQRRRSQSWCGALALSEEAHRDPLTSERGAEEALRGRRIGYPPSNALGAAMGCPLRRRRLHGGRRESVGSRRLDGSEPPAGSWLVAGAEGELGAEARGPARPIPPFRRRSAKTARARRRAKVRSRLRPTTRPRPQARIPRVRSSFAIPTTTSRTKRAARKDASIFDAACAPIARVTKAFHDHVCVQGSGRLESGATVSFAKRGCTCAAVCPRTSQQICFERLDPARFPNGRGATGRPITPPRTLAVDSAVIALGTTGLHPRARRPPTTRTARAMTGASSPKIAASA